jgi:hypothetical protein
MEWALVLMFLMGVISGVIATNVIFLRKRITGDLVVVDDVHEDKPYIFLNINHEDLDSLHDSELIKLSVDRKKPRKRNA